MGIKYKKQKAVKPTHDILHKKLSVPHVKNYMKIRYRWYWILSQINICIVAYIEGAGLSPDTGIATNNGIVKHNIK